VLNAALEENQTSPVPENYVVPQPEHGDSQGDTMIAKEK
jgi:hypothetical protein